MIKKEWGFQQETCLEFHAVAHLQPIQPFRADFCNKMLFTHLAYFHP
jgi:hypothetical protein